MKTSPHSDSPINTSSAPEVEEIILGVHSIACAIKNPRRDWHELIMTEDCYKKIRALVPGELMKSTKIRHLDTHQFQQVAASHYKRLGYDFGRITSGGLLLAKPLRSYASVSEFLTEAALTKNKLVLPKHQLYIALDQVTDINNAGAILRTCAFYGVTGLIIPTGHSFRVTPSFSRIASGGLETVPIIRVNSLASTLLKAKEKYEAQLIGFSEEATQIWEKQTATSESAPESISILVFGAEETGISNAVERILTQHYKLSSRPQLTKEVPLHASSITSLNVSVSVAIGLDRFYH